ncbi:GFA family protein [Methyloglobulus sp.]|uniref:GFA family protein n=1 Tax=Methyloglobulus sp. TaxID=2518622 RepID=UPI0032B7DEE4
MKLPMTGGCLCGKVRYEISAQPVSTANCHCRSCQKSVGAPHLAIFVVPTSSFTVMGNYREYITIAASGNKMHRNFCPECGTSLFVINSGFPQFRPVSAMTLDDPSDYKPEKDIWVADAQPWDVMDPELPKFAGNPQ